jgi:hypothetical protein
VFKDFPFVNHSFIPQETNRNEYSGISTPHSNTGTLWSPLLNVATSNSSQTSSSPMITEVSDDTSSSSSISILPQSQISSLKTQKDAVRLYAVAMYGMIRLSTECVRGVRARSARNLITSLKYYGYHRITHLYRHTHSRITI